MIKKSYSKSGKKCRVTFKLSAAELSDAETVQVLGDFNDWEPESTPLKRRKSGAFSTTASVKSGRDYRFRYLVDGKRWVSDGEADGLVPNRFGDLDSVLAVAAAQ